MRQCARTGFAGRTVSASTLPSSCDRPPGAPIETRPRSHWLPPSTLSSGDKAERHLPQRSKNPLPPILINNSLTIFIDEATKMPNHDHPLGQPLAFVVAVSMRSLRNKYGAGGARSV